MTWQYTPYTLPLLGAAAISTALAFYAWRRRSAPGVVPFIGLMLAVAVWSLGYALELASANLPAKLLWAKIQYLGIVTVPVAWLAFALQYTNRARWLTRRNLLLLALPSLITLLLVWTNDLHHLIWTSTRLDSGGPFSVLVLTHGAVFGGIVVYGYSSILLGSALLFQALFRRPKLYRRQVIAVLIAVLAPWVGNALYVSGLNPFPYLDLTPLAFALSSLVAVWGLFRFRLLDIVPVARDAVLDSMDDAVIVLDAQGRIVDLNPAAERLATCLAADVIGRPAAKALSALPALAQRCSEAAEAQGEIILGEGEARRTHELSSSPLPGPRGRPIGRLVVLRDMTERKQAEQVTKDSELKYRTLFEASTDAVFLETLDGRVLDCNATACEMLGYTKEELTGLTVADLVPGEVAKTLPDLITEELTTGGIFVEATNKRKDGQVFPVEVSTQLITIGEEQLAIAYVRDVSERKRLEQQSKERRLYLESVLACAPDAIVTLDAQHRILDWNRGAEALFGYPREEVIGRGLDGLVSGSQQKTLEEATRLTRQVLAGTPVPPTEAVRYRKDGSPVDVIVAGGPIIVQGEVTGVVAIYTNLAERKRSEKAIRESEEKYRTLVEQSLQGVMIARGTPPALVYANAAVADILGYSVPELLSLSREGTRALVHPDDQALFFQRYQDRLAGKATPPRYELRTVRKDGAVRWVEMFASRIELGGGPAVQATFVDITERKRAEQELRESEERYRSLYSMVRLMCDNVPDMIWAKDMDRRFIFANQAICDKLLHAGDSDEPIGKTDLFFAERERSTHPKDPHWHSFGEICADSDLVVMSSRQPQKFDEFGNVRGEFLFLDVYKAPFRDEHGEMIGTVGSARIVTREKEVEKQREQAREALRRRTEQLEALRQVGLEIGSQLDVDTLLHSIVSRAVELLDGTIGAFYLYRPEQDALQIVVAVGAHPDIVGRTLAPGEGLAGKVQSCGQPIVVDDYRQWEGRAAVYDNQNFRATVGVPVCCGEEFMGVLDVVADTPGVFSSSDVELLSLFATQAAIAIQNARLYDETRRRNRELALLNRVIAASAASQEIEPILETVCRELAEAFEVPHSAAALLNAGKTEIVVAAEHRADGRSSVLGQTIPVADIPVARELLEHKMPVMIDDARSDPRLGPICSLIPPDDPLPLLLLPILIEGEMVGGLGVAAVGARSFSPEEVDLARRVAEQVSGALARARLAETERRLSTAVDQAAEGMVVTDAEGKIIYVNPAFERIVGYTRAEVMGQQPRILGSSGLDQFFQGGMRQAVAGGQAWQEKLEYSRRDGRVCHLDMTIAPVRDLPGEIVSYVTTMRDVTHETQLEAEFQQAQKMEALGRLASGVAHDINNLLAVIQISAQLMERKLHAGDPLRAHVGPIRDTVYRATRLTGQLVRFSRGEVIKPRVLNLNQVVADLSTMLQRIIGEDIHLVTALADDLGPIQADPAQIDQVIANLAVNARDAMPAGGVLTIETSNVVLDQAYADLHLEAQPGEYVLLAVSDTGVGMDDGVKARIFEPFFTTKEPGQGTGLGLATVFGIVKQGRGRIEVYSEVGQGTAFKIYWPRIQEAEAWPEAPSGALPSIPGSLVGGTETVLLVEDDAPVRELAERILQSCGYLVLAAGDGLEALQIGEDYDGPIHLLLTDVVLPHMRGTELAGRLFHRRPGMRVLYMSGYTDGAVAQQGVLPPGVFFLGKPFTIEDLTQTVREVLDRGA